MELLVAVAIGLNPYAGAFVLAALAAFTGRVPLSETGALLPAAGWGLLALLAGGAMPVDFVLGKFVRFAPRVRYAGHVIAPLAAGLGAVAVQQWTAVPTPVVAALAALVAWTVNAGLTATAARASRAADSIGLGHIPVLMSAGVGAACVIPLGLALPALGYGLVGFTLLMLGVSQLDSAPRRPLRVAARPAPRSTAVPAQAAVAPALPRPVTSPALRSVGRATGRAYARAAYARAC